MLAPSPSISRIWLALALLAIIGKLHAFNKPVIHQSTNPSSFDPQAYRQFALSNSGDRRNGERYVAPIFAYPHSFGVSVTGGYVYRANPKSSLYGVYIFGDYESRRVWGLTHRNRRLKKIRELGRSPSRIASFGLDSAGELYVVGYEGTIYQIDFSASRFE